MYQEYTNLHKKEKSNIILCITAKKYCMNCLGNIKLKDQAKLLDLIVTVNFLGQANHICGW